jgi:murein DD-endopeptidase MepM/ murein hydrolase activator NlpD
MKHNRILFFVIFGLFSVVAYAQPDKKKNKDKDFLKIKAPAIEYTSPDINNVMFEEDFTDTAKAKESYKFEPSKQATIMDEPDDTAFFDEDEEGDLQVVEVNEQINIDSFWVTIAQYYAIWDSRTINPYKIDGADYKDTVVMMLHDSLSGYNWSMPLNSSKINSRFGMRKYRWHYGTDLDLTIGDPVKAVFDGMVRIVQFDSRGYGRYIVIRHYNGLETLYGHLTAAQVSVGQLVKAGEVIGLGGNTGRSSGPHLHFEVRYEGNAFDPMHVYDFENHTLRGKNFALMPYHFAYLKEARKVYYHTIRSGESLGSISRKYRVSISQLCKLNRISTKTMLRVGRKLRIR